LPVLAWLGCLIFGFTDSVASNLQSFGLSSEIMPMIPYVITVAVLAIAMARSARALKMRKSALAGYQGPAKGEDKREEKKDYPRLRSRTRRCGGDHARRQGAFA
jgi:simple sugar transport system permease protein